MSDDVPMPETPAERAEAQAIRRRWITLGEGVAVAAVIISGLTFWLNYSDKRSAEAEKQAEKASETAAATRVTLKGSPASDGRMLRLSDSNAAIQEISVRFPAALGISAKESAVEPGIEAGWFDSSLLAMTDGGVDERTGKLPVLITASWWDGDSRHSDTALYDVVWRTKGRMLQGRTLTLRGITLRQRVKGDGKAELEAAWAKEKPRA